MTDGGLVPIVLRTLRQAGWKATRLQAGTARGGAQRLADAGWPDVLALRPKHPFLCIDGEAVLIECKTPKGKLRPEQIELEQWCDDNGISYVVVRSTDDIEKLVRRG